MKKTTIALCHPHSYSGCQQKPGSPEAPRGEMNQIQRSSRNHLRARTAFGPYIEGRFDIAKLKIIKLPADGKVQGWVEIEFPLGSATTPFRRIKRSLQSEAFKVNRSVTVLFVV